MASDLSLLLHKFLDLYKRDPDALHRHLDDPILVDSEDIPPVEQLGLIREGERIAQERIGRNTLINTSGATARHALLQNALGDSREHAANTASDKNLQRLLARAKSKPNPNPEFFADNARKWQEQEDSAVELLRYFADRIDAVSAAFNILPDEDFDVLIPEASRPLFRECHLNIAFGNTRTCMILCGAILESALKYAMPISNNEKPHELIKVAERIGHFTSNEGSQAHNIVENRNRVVHGIAAGPSMTVKAAYQELLATRNLVAKLYMKSKKEA